MKDKVIHKNKINKNGKIGFIFSTYDDASFLWPDFFRLMKQFWPEWDSFFDNYISMAESKEIIASDSLIIKPLGLSNNNYSYSERLIECINILDCEYVFIILDDFYVKSRVDTERFTETIDFIKHNQYVDCIDYEHFRKMVRNEETGIEYLKYLRKGKFLCTLQIGLWRSSSLLKVIRMKENPWMFEYYGSVRGIIYNLHVLTIKVGEKAIFDYDCGWLLIRGKFDKSIYDRYVNELGIDKNMGDLIGYQNDKHANKRVSILTRFKHMILAIISFFKR